MWMAVIAFSLLIGYAIGRLVPWRHATWLGALVPWLLLLLIIVAEDHLTTRPGSSMWGLAQLIGGSVAAACGALGARLAKK